MPIRLYFYRGHTRDYSGDYKRLEIELRARARPVKLVLQPHNLLFKNEIISNEWLHAYSLALPQP